MRNAVYAAHAFVLVFIACRNAVASQGPGGPPGGAGPLAQAALIGGVIAALALVAVFARRRHR